MSGEESGRGSTMEFILGSVSTFVAAMATGTCRTAVDYPLIAARRHFQGGGNWEQYKQRFSGIRPSQAATWPQVFPAAYPGYVGYTGSMVLGVWGQTVLGHWIKENTKTEENPKGSRLAYLASGAFTGTVLVAPLEAAGMLPIYANGLKGYMQIFAEMAAKGTLVPQVLLPSPVAGLRDGIFSWFNWFVAGNLKDYLHEKLGFGLLSSTLLATAVSTTFNVPICHPLDTFFTQVVRMGYGEAIRSARNTLAQPRGALLLFSILMQGWKWRAATSFTGVGLLQGFGELTGLKKPDDQERPCLSNGGGYGPSPRQLDSVGVRAAVEGGSTGGVMATRDARLSPAETSREGFSGEAFGPDYMERALDAAYQP